MYRYFAISGLRVDANSVCGCDPPLPSYLFLHFYAVDFIEDEVSVNGNV